MTINTTTDFDGGGGAIKSKSGENHIEIELKDDKEYQYKGYFCFRLEGAKGETVSFDITNVEETNGRMPEYYNLHYSTNSRPYGWEQFDGHIANGFEHTFEDDQIYLASWPAYPYESTVDRAKSVAQNHPNLVETEVIGQSYEGRDMHVITISDPAVDDMQAQDIVGMARQHPGETHGSFHLDGIIETALDHLGSGPQSFEKNFVFHLFPNINPDGMYHGYHYHDAQGNNLNREWADNGPVEIVNVRDHLSDEVSHLHWGFDLHASTDPTFAAVLRWRSNMSEKHLSMIKDIESASLSLTGISSGDDTKFARGWMHDELPGKGTAITTEAWTYFDYTTAEIEQEGCDFLTAATQY